MVRSGLATANSISVINGARQIECTLMELRKSRKYFSRRSGYDLRQHPYLNLDTNINSKYLYPISQLVSESMNDFN